MRSNSLIAIASSSIASVRQFSNCDCNINPYLGTIILVSLRPVAKEKDRIPESSLGDLRLSRLLRSTKGYKLSVMSC